MRLSGRVEFDSVAHQRRQHLSRAFPPERIQPQLHVVALVTPFMAVFGAIVDQQKHASISDAVG
jgi:hypothetical protein